MQVTPAARAEWESMRAFPNSVSTLFRGGGTGGGTGGGVDTVGAVAMDAGGNVAAATSTGGITCKMPGRVGDSPIVGAGCHADNECGAASCTGHGESLLRVSAAQGVSHLMGQGVAPGAACAATLERMHARVNGHGGIISIDRRGRIGFAFTTERMAWAAVGNDGTVQRGIDREREAPAGAREGGVAVEARELPG